MQENFEKQSSNFGQNAVACVPSPDRAASGSVPFAPGNAPETYSVVRFYWLPFTPAEPSEKIESLRLRSLTKKYRRASEKSEELAEIPKVDSESFDLDRFEVACASHRACFEKWNEILAEFSRSFADCDSHPFTPDDSVCVMCGASATKYIKENNRLACLDCGHTRSSVREHRGFWSRPKQLEDPAWDYDAEGTDAIFETKEHLPKISKEEFSQAILASKTAFDERNISRHKSLWLIFREGWTIADAAKETGEDYDSVQKRARRFFIKVEKLRGPSADIASAMKLPRRFQMKAVRAVIRNGVAVDVNFGTLTEREKVRISLPRFDPNLNGVFVKEPRDDGFPFWIQVHLDGKDGNFAEACAKALEYTRDQRRDTRPFIDAALRYLRNNKIA